MRLAKNFHCGTSRVWRCPTPCWRGHVDVEAQVLTSDVPTDWLRAVSPTRTAPYQLSDEPSPTPIGTEYSYVQQHASKTVATSDWIHSRVSCRRGGPCSLRTVNGWRAEASNVFETFPNILVESEENNNGKIIIFIETRMSRAPARARFGRLRFVWTNKTGSTHKYYSWRVAPKLKPFRVSSTG